MADRPGTKDAEWKESHPRFPSLSEPVGGFRGSPATSGRDSPAPPWQPQEAHRMHGH
jgi:hypothetical protein